MSTMNRRAPGPTGFKCHSAVPCGALCLSRALITSADTHRRREWRFCHLQDTEGDACGCEVGLGGTVTEDDRCRVSCCIYGTSASVVQHSLLHLILCYSSLATLGSV